MIYVFKTSVQTKMHAQQLKPHLDAVLSGAKWNFDLDDCDNILRIDSEENIVLKIQALFNNHHFYCEELE